jgi:benzoylformate decarboxylase
MRGAQVFMESLLQHDVRCIFGNPGTTENSLLDRLIDYPQLTYYVALHEGIAVGAANFYAQASGKVAVANLHVAPGLGNAIGMMYGALKANSPIVVTAGQQDTRMRLNNPLLSHDLVAMAQAVTKFSAEPHSADEMGPLLRRAFKIAMEPPRGPVFIALPVNVMEQETNIGASTAGRVLASTASVEAIAAARELIVASRNPCIVTGDEPARDGAFASVVACAEAMGAAVYNEGLRAQLSFPNQHLNYRGRLPYTNQELGQVFASHDLIVLLGGPFFENIWHDDSNPFPAGAKVIQIENNAQQVAFNFSLDLGISGDLRSSLAELNCAIRAADSGFHAQAKVRNAALADRYESKKVAVSAEMVRVSQDTPMHPLCAMHTIASALPKDVVVVDESITSFPNVASQFDFKQAGDYFAGRGGGIGQGLAGVIGTQVALPNKRVVVISGDGSAMYSIQALWTAVHHKLPIIFIIMSNREYRVLKHNLDTFRTRFDVKADKPYPNMDLATPSLNFADMARGMGMRGEVVSDVQTLAAGVAQALSCAEPYLIEVIVAGKR